jgi:hypothetical protein
MSKLVALLRKEEERLTGHLAAIKSALSVLGDHNGSYGKPTTKHRLSAAGRARIANAQRARWARVRAGKRTGKRADTTVDQS